MVRQSTCATRSRSTRAWVEGLIQARGVTLVRFWNSFRIGSRMSKLAPARLMARDWAMAEGASAGGRISPGAARPAAPSRWRRRIGMVPVSLLRSAAAAEQPERGGGAEDRQQRGRRGGGADGVEFRRQLPVELRHHRQRQGDVGAGGEHAAGEFVV